MVDVLPANCNYIVFHSENGDCEAGIVNSDFYKICWLEYNIKLVFTQFISPVTSTN